MKIPDDYPKGFASSVTGWLRTYVIKERMRYDNTASLDRKNAWALLESVASAAASAGDSDARVQIIYGPFERKFGRSHFWEPGHRQLAYIQTVGIVDPQAPVPTPDEFLTELAGAAFRDMESLQRDEMEALKHRSDTPPEFEQVLAGWQQRAETAEAQVTELSRSREHLRQEAITQKAETRRLREAIQFNRPIEFIEAEDHIAEDAEPEKLPEGVRRRGQFYEAYWREVDGKQKSKSGFRTVSEAEAYYKDRKDEVAALRAKRAKHGPEAPELHSGPVAA